MSGDTPSAGDTSDGNKPVVNHSRPSLEAGHEILGNKYTLEGWHLEETHMYAKGKIAFRAKRPAVTCFNDPPGFVQAMRSVSTTITTV